MKKFSMDDGVIRWVCLVSFVFFFVWGIFAVMYLNSEYIFDRFFSAAIILFVFLMFKKMKLTLPVVLFGLFILSLHHLKLYGNFYFGIPFDMIMHFTAGVALVLIFSQYLLGLRIKAGHLIIAVLAVLIALGIGSLNEIMEFIGYSFLGKGEGLLFYGTGDFGEWNNSCWDMICNTLGAVSGVLFYFSVIKIRKFYKN